MLAKRRSVGIVGGPGSGAGITAGVSKARRSLMPSARQLQPQHQQQQQQHVFSLQLDAKPVVTTPIFLAPTGTPPASAARRQQQQQLQQQQHRPSPRSSSVRFSTPSQPPPHLKQQLPPHLPQASSHSAPRPVPVARKSTDLRRIRDPDLRHMALINSPMIDSRPRGANRASASFNNSSVGGGRRSMLCFADSPMSVGGEGSVPQSRRPRLTQPAAEDGTSPQAVWRTLFCDEADAAEASADSAAPAATEARVGGGGGSDCAEAAVKYRMLLHQQLELMRFLIDDWKEVSVSESVPPCHAGALSAALADACRITRADLPAFEVVLAKAAAAAGASGEGSVSAACLHAAWAGVQAGIVAVRQRFAELEADRLGGWPPAF